MHRVKTYYAVLLLGFFATATIAEDAEDAEPLEEIVVTGVSVDQNALSSTSISIIDENAIDRTAAFHPHEIFARVPGVWVTRNSGQEHLTAIRSGVLTGAGACGAFLLLENGIPVRPAGFCNVNGLFEVNTEQASQLEVIRGPASARYGGNALYGLVNAVTFNTQPDNAISLRLGSDAFRQGRVEIGNDTIAFQGHVTNDGGYREQTGLDQYKGNLEVSSNFGTWSSNTMVSATKLEQETGGYVNGFEVYKNNELRFSNPNPEAYRNASSFRVMTLLQHSDRDDWWSFTPYFRSSSMTFLQHFLPGKPLEENSQQSGGLVVNKTGAFGEFRWNLNGQVELMDAELKQSQKNPTTGSAFLVATRPPGTHYNYSVSALTAAGFYDVTWQINEQTEIHHLARFERLAYDYENHHLVGNTKDDGSACGFGGCLYSRPADRKDTFTNLGFNLGVEHTLNDEHRLYGLIAKGFRPPQSTELYRLQSGQQIADLNSEQLLSVEFGIRSAWNNWSSQISLFSMKARDLVLRDSEGFNVSLGRTKGLGVEWDIQFSPTEAHQLNFVGSLADHTYDFTRTVSRGERIESGNQVDSAPRQVGSIHWSWAISAGVSSEIEYSYVGKHYLNASNTAEYKGHSVMNWFGFWTVSEKLAFQGKISNLFDQEYADRADYAFGNYRYFPAPPRQFLLGIRYHLN